MSEPRFTGLKDFQELLRRGKACPCPCPEFAFIALHRIEQNFTPITKRGNNMRKSISKIALAATLGIAITFTFSCSTGGDDDGDGNPNVGISSSSITVPSSSSVPLPSSSSVAAISSSSSIIVETQYYDVMLGNWSNSCPNLNDYPELRNNVIAVNESFISTLQTCLINSESYTQNTSSQVSNFLATNGLSGYANDFNLRIAASPYNTAFLIYTNTSNYFRVLIIGFSD